MDYEVASAVIGAYCVEGDDKDKEWFVKVPEIQEYMTEPSQPARCLPDLMDSAHQFYQSVSKECRFGGPGSTINCWAVSVSAMRLTLCVRMHPTAAFLSMPNASGTIAAGEERKSLWLQ